MRQYEPAWNKLKQDTELRIAAEPSVHKRIIKAVIKEKDMDIIYKLSCEEECKRAVISYSRQHKMIVFKLKFVHSRISRSDF